MNKYIKAFLALVATSAMSCVPPTTAPTPTPSGHYYVIGSSQQ